MQGVNPDEVVAIGAASTRRCVGWRREGCSTLDVTPLSLGIETMGGIYEVD